MLHVLMAIRELEVTAWELQLSLDSTMVINAIKGSTSKTWQKLRTYREIETKPCWFLDVEFFYLPRNANSIVDALSHVCNSIA